MTHYSESSVLIYFTILLSKYQRTGYQDVVGGQLGKFREVTAASSTQIAVRYLADKKVFPLNLAIYNQRLSIRRSQIEEKNLWKWKKICEKWKIHSFLEIIYVTLVVTCNISNIVQIYILSDVSRLIEPRKTPNGFPDYIYINEFGFN